MVTKSRSSKSILDWLSHIEKNPYPFTYHKIIRVLEAANNDKPRVGKALSLKDEYVRLRQPAYLHHPSSELAGFSNTQEVDDRFELSTYLFGLLGPNGPMPHHITSYLRQRQLAKDMSPIAFFDLFNHRFLSHYYRAWADTEPVTQLDRPSENNINSLIAAISGLETSKKSKQLFPKEVEFFFAGHFARNDMTVEGLTKILTSYFECAFSIKRFSAKWVNTPEDDRFTLNHSIINNKQLGRNTLIGKRVLSAQHELMIYIYPNNFDQYTSFLALENQWLETLVSLVKRCIGLSFSWQLCFCLPKKMIPVQKLGKNTILDKNNWLTFKHTEIENQQPIINKEKHMVFQTISPVKYLNQRFKQRDMKNELHNQPTQRH